MGWLPWSSTQRDFSESVVLTSGDLIIAQDSERAIQVDVLQMKEGGKPSSILARSNLFTGLDLTPSGKVSAARIARWMRKPSKNVVRLVIFFMTVLLYFVTKESVQAWIAARISWGPLVEFLNLLIFALTAMIGDALWDMAKGYLSVASPEDTEVVESVFD